MSDVTCREAQSNPACDVCAEINNRGLCEHYGCDLCGNSPVHHRRMKVFMSGKARQVWAAVCRDCEQLARMTPHDEITHYPAEERER